MAGSLGAVSLLDVTFTIDDAAGVDAGYAVVQGAADGTVKKPTAANAGAFVGITRTKAAQNKGVNVQMAGIARCVAAGAIARGDRVNIADNTGKIASVEATVAAGLSNPASVVNVIGFALNTTVNSGDIVYVRIAPDTVPLAVS